MIRRNVEKIEVAHIDAHRGLRMFSTHSLMKPSFLGKIYRGRVHKVAKGIQAAFIHLEGELFGFLHVKNIYSAYEGGEQLPCISSLLQEGQPILVQVSKDFVREKHLRVTTFVTLPARFLVYNPFYVSSSDLGGAPSGKGMVQVSLRILDSVVRDHWVRRVEHLFPLTPLIVRTSCEEPLSDKDLEKDFAYLETTWKSIQEAFATSKAPVLFDGESHSYRLVRDHLTHQVSRLIVDNEKDYLLIQEACEALCPENLSKIIFHKPSLGGNIFDEFPEVEKGLKKALSKKVYLPSGGTICIEESEGLTCIDVNTAQATKAKKENLLFQVNCEAAHEVARQLMLRNIGGVIHIDFIDMPTDQEKQDLQKLMESLLKDDLHRPQIIGFSSLSILAITRKRTGPSLKETLHRECPVCQGKGGLLQGPEVFRKALDVMSKIHAATGRKEFTLFLRPDVYKWCCNSSWAKQMKPSNWSVTFKEGDYGLGFVVD